MVAKASEISPFSSPNFELPAAKKTPISPIFLYATDNNSVTSILAKNTL
jgi:hypothetical protein